MATKAVWGPSVWYLFHTLSCKVKEEQFIYIKDDLLTFIYSICASLPCPECAEHSTGELKKLNKSTIRNKDDFKKMLFQFHNHVNIRTKKPLFKYEDLEVKYNNAITKNVVYHFLEVMSRKHHNIRILTNDFQRDRMLQNFRSWLSINSNKFNP